MDYTLRNIAVFASGGGSGLQAIINGCKSGRLKNARVCLVISNNSNCHALQRAKNSGIPAHCLLQEKSILEALFEHKTHLIFLSGYLKKIDVSILDSYKNRIYNIHPSLLPKYGGKGMYGINVHKAVLEAGEVETGITIHRVNSEYDTGQIIAQQKIAILKGDTPEILAARVLDKEHVFVIEILNKILENDV